MDTDREQTSRYRFCQYNGHVVVEMEGEQEMLFAAWQWTGRKWRPRTWVPATTPNQTDVLCRWIDDMTPYLDAAGYAR